jgi:hypothetical protein
MDYYFTFGMSSRSCQQSSGESPTASLIMCGGIGGNVVATPIDSVSGTLDCDRMEVASQPFLKTSFAFLDLTRYYKCKV